MKRVKGRRESEASVLGAVDNTVDAYELSTLCRISPTKTDTHKARELEHQEEKWAGGESQDQLQEVDRVKLPLEFFHLHALLLQGALRVLHEVDQPVSSSHMLTKTG